MRKCEIICNYEIYTCIIVRISEDVKRRFNMYATLEKLLKENGITAYCLCKAIGISPSTISDWKSGRSKPKTDKLQKIAAFFRVPITVFIVEEEVDA